MLPEKRNSFDMSNNQLSYYQWSPRQVVLHMMDLRPIVLFFKMHSVTILRVKIVDLIFSNSGENLNPSNQILPWLGEMIILMKWNFVSGQNTFFI